jgi:hypothetical protein
LLDSPGEWFIDPAAQLLYLWPPQNDMPAGHVVEARQRDYAFDLSGRSYITVQGVSLFACAVNSSSASQFLVLDHLTCRYLSHYSLIDTSNNFGYHMEDTGIILKGSHHTLSNSHLAYSSGNGVTVLGDHHLVTNCTVHDVNYLEDDCGAINTGNSSSTSTDHEISYNTCYNGARGLLLIRSLVRGYVHHNDLYRSMMRTTDGGAIYSFGHDGQNTDISYNRIHDNVCGGNPGSGVYLDNNSTNFHVHHNLIYNTQDALHYNLPSVNILWYNNTAVAFNQSLTGSFTGSQSGTEVRNNIFTQAIVTFTGATLSNNILSTTDPLFVSPADLDFRIQSSSPAHDTGMVLSPYTDGYEGAAPDIGALEFSQTWSAGASPGTGIPAAPTGLAATAAGGAIQLGWTDNSGNESSFVLERSTDNKVFAEIARLPANSTSYTDATVIRGTTYYYHVRADESANSNHASAAISGHDAYATIQAESLDAQSGLTVSSVIGSCDNNDWAKYANVDFGAGAAQISLRVASGATAMTNFVEVHLGSTTGTRIANINILGTGSYGTYTTVTSAVSAVTGVQDVYLVFKGGSGVCNMDYFSFVPVNTLAVPPPPTGMSANALSQTQIQAGWTPPGATEDGFKIERSTDNQLFTEIASVVAGVSTLLDSGLASGTSYFYRTRTFNKQGFSGYTSTAMATTWTPVQAWRELYFNTIANSGSAADTAAPDGDGVGNLLKYGLLIVPGRSGVALLPVPGTKVYVDGERLAVTFARDPSRSDISILVEVAGDPSGSWTTVASSTNGGAMTGAGLVSESAGTGGLLNVEVRDTVNVDASVRRYMRVRVSH